jgi:hypothetical protein
MAGATSLALAVLSTLAAAHASGIRRPTHEKGPAARFARRWNFGLWDRFFESFFCRRALSR